MKRMDNNIAVQVGLSLLFYPVAVNNISPYPIEF